MVEIQVSASKAKAGASARTTGLNINVRNALEWFSLMAHGSNVSAGSAKQSENPQPR
jgi:hypothetical protein